MHSYKKIAAGLVLASAAMTTQAGELSANIGISNNYLWRGLTQSTNEPAISGGVDWAHESGFYIGTWVSNVQYASDDAFSYEHDVYFGYAGEYNGVSYDIGYLYYNYDEEADFDFGEIYGSIGFGGFSATAFVFAHTEADEDAGIANRGEEYDFDFGHAYYISLDYGFAVPNTEDVEIGLHLGYHDGDFVDAFNFGDGTDNYWDYAASISKGGFSLMVSDTDLDDSPTGLQNDSVKFVVSYSVDF